MLRFNFPSAFDLCFVFEERRDTNDANLSELFAERCTDYPLIPPSSLQVVLVFALSIGALVIYFIDSSE